MPAYKIVHQPEIGQLDNPAPGAKHRLQDVCTGKVAGRGIPVIDRLNTAGAI